MMVSTIHFGSILVESLKIISTFQDVWLHDTAINFHHGENYLNQSPKKIKSPKSKKQVYKKQSQKKVRKPRNHQTNSPPFEESDSLVCNNFARNGWTLFLRRFCRKHCYCNIGTIYSDVERIFLTNH